MKPTKSDKILMRERIPQLTPDLIDHFVTWLTAEGINMHSFKTSSIALRREFFYQFWKQLDPKYKQFKIEFPEH